MNVVVLSRGPSCQRSVTSLDSIDSMWRAKVESLEFHIAMIPWTFAVTDRPPPTTKIPPYLEEDGLKRLNFTTLRARFLLPLLVTALFAAMLVAAVSSSLGRRWALQDVHDRFADIEHTLDRSNFPLTLSVLNSLADLTGTELVTLGNDNVVLSETLGTANEIRNASAGEVAANAEKIAIQGRTYLAFSFRRSGMTVHNDQVERVFVLFHQRRVDEASRRAALMPLATGISTIVMLSSVMVAITGALVRRLERLQQGVKRVAAGDFDAAVSDKSKDEVGQLGAAVDSMSCQLRQLWRQVNRQQGEKLLHQIAGGMAHQLRNTLTGSRMALELHQQNCASANKEEVEVALRQMEVAEDYVRRLLLVSAGQQQEDRAESLVACLQYVRSSHAAVAKHLRVELNWNWDATINDSFVTDGPTFSASIANLVLNAIQAASAVDVSVKVTGEACVITVCDNGPGVESEIAAEIFEPFVTSKPEGMGLGLPLVRRAATHLGGEVKWSRANDRTIFQFRCKVQRAITKETTG